MAPSSGQMTYRNFPAFIWKKHVQKYFCTKYFRWGHWLAFQERLFSRVYRRLFLYHVSLFSS